MIWLGRELRVYKPDYSHPAETDTPSPDPDCGPATTRCIWKASAVPCSSKTVIDLYHAWNGIAKSDG